MGYTFRINIMGKNLNTSFSIHIVSEWWHYFSKTVVSILWDKTNEKWCDILIVSFPVSLTTSFIGAGKRTYLR